MKPTITKTNFFVKEAIRSKYPFDRGWGNGYVVLNKKNPLHGKQYDEIDLDVNGGLTFSSSISDIQEWPESKGYDMDSWVLGFDTANFGDTLANFSKNAVIAETKKLLATCQEMEETI